MPESGTHIPQGRHFFVMAYDCGHSIWISKRASAGIDWCPVCHAYVGVIVTRKDGTAE